MAKCAYCGKSASLFSTMCNECKNECKKAARDEQIAEQERINCEIEQKSQQAREAYQSRRSEMLSTAVQSLQQQLANGENMYFFESIYLPVDSKVVNDDMAEEFSLGALKQLGINGWKVVAVIPRTVGVALMNETYGSSAGRTWGAGVGGNVVGVHIVVGKEITANNTQISAEFLTEYIDRNLFDFITEDDVRTLTEMLE